MSHSCEYFLDEALARNLDDAWSRQPGCHSPPFFKIPIENVILDELTTFDVADYRQTRRRPHPLHP